MIAEAIKGPQWRACVILARHIGLLALLCARCGELPLVEGVVDEDLQYGQKRLLVGAQHPQSLLTALAHHALHACQLPRHCHHRLDALISFMEEVQGATFGSPSSIAQHAHQHPANSRACKRFAISVR